MGKYYTPTQQQAGALLATQVGQAEAARRVGAKQDTIHRWLLRYHPSQSPTPTPSDEEPTYLATLESGDTQTQAALIASQQDEMPRKQEKIALAETAFMAYGLKSLDLVDETRSPEMAAKVAKSWFDTLSLLVEGRHRSPTVVTEQHLHTGPEYHRAAASNAAKHPKHRRK